MHQTSPAGNPIRLAPLLAALLAFLPSPAPAATVDVGSGPVTSRFVLDSPNLGTRDYRVHHAGVTDAYGLLLLVLAHDPSISTVIYNFGSIANPNYFVNSVTWSGVTETSNPASPWVPYWGHWVAGGSAGFPASAVAPVPPGAWQQGSGISAPYRVVGEGTWDALVYGDDTTPPRIQPVPEPGILTTFTAGLLFIAFARRRV